MKRHLPILAGLSVLAALAAEAQGVHLRGRIIRVGYVGRGAQQDAIGADHYRPGAWTPILVELTNDDGDLFEGAIEVRQPDRDGDDIVASTAVAVRGTRTYYLYVPAAPPSARGVFGVRVSGPGGGLVQLHDDQNKPVRELRPASEPRPIAGDSRVILDISQPPLNYLDTLAFNPLSVHPIVVLRVAGSELPDKLPGLQIADTVVWDDADPTKLRDVTQQQALIEWTRQGGTLVLGIARNWQELSRSLLGELLPAKLTGTTSAAQLEQLSQALLDLNVPFDSPLVHCPVHRSDMASDAVSVIPPEADSSSQIYVARRPCGRGEIVLVAAEIHDLMARGTQNEVFLRDLLAIRNYPAGQQPQGTPGSADLFERCVEQSTAFQMTTGLYFLVAFLFVVVYMLAATGGSWTWLKRRQKLHYAWLGFAAVAVLASATSLLAVQAIRGIGYRVHQLTILDGRAGSTDAGATCYFGLKTPVHTLLDLAVPSDRRKPDESLRVEGSLFPLPTDPDDLDPKSYSAGQAYAAVAPLGQLQRVPLRATLKQFQGYWQGRIDGQMIASLRHRDTSSFRMAADSWIENRLGCDLHDCHLFVAGRNLSGDRSARTHRGRDIEVYPLGNLADGKRVVLGPWMVDQVRQRRPKTEAETSITPEDWHAPFLQTMADDGWFGKVGLRMPYSPGYDNEARREVTADEWVSGMLLISLCDELDQRELMQRDREIRPTRSRELDRSLALTRDMALLIGFSDNDPGPARLCWRPPTETPGGWRPIDPDRARTVYRIAIPVSDR